MDSPHGLHVSEAAAKERVNQVRALRQKSGTVRTIVVLSRREVSEGVEIADSVARIALPVDEGVSRSTRRGLLGRVAAEGVRVRNVAQKSINRSAEGTASQCGCPGAVGTRQVSTRLTPVLGGGINHERCPFEIVGCDRVGAREVALDAGGRTRANLFVAQATVRASPRSARNHSRNRG